MTRSLLQHFCCLSCFGSQSQLPLDVLLAPSEFESCRHPHTIIATPGAKHFTQVSLRGSPKPKLNSELKMWRYMNNDISGLRSGGAALLTPM